MTQDERKTIMYAQGRADAMALQEKAPDMTGTEIIAEESKVPAFNPQKDYSGWPVGAPVSDGGQVWSHITQPAIRGALRTSGRSGGWRTPQTPPVPRRG